MESQFPHPPRIPSVISIGLSSEKLLPWDSCRPHWRTYHKESQTGRQSALEKKQALLHASAASVAKINHMLKASCVTSTVECNPFPPTHPFPLLRNPKWTILQIAYKVGDLKLRSSCSSVLHILLIDWLDTQTVSFRPSVSITLVHVSAGKLASTFMFSARAVSGCMHFAIPDIVPDQMWGLYC